MELLDRYLHAVKFWLPRQQQDDIIAEISEDLRSQIEDREQQAGRKLSDTEIADLLKQRGRPLLVANRYLPQHSLIGPVLFPIYMLVLKIAALCFMIPRVLVLIGFFIFDPKYHTEGLGALIMRTWSELWFGGFVTFGIVTLVFAVLERTQQQSGWLEKWDPRKLPKVRDTRRIPRASSVFDVVVNIVALMWLIEIASSGVLMQPAGIHIALTPSGRGFAWIVTALVLFGIGMSSINLFRPFWTRSRLAIRVIQDLISTLVFGLMARAGALIMLSGSNIPVAKTAEVNSSVNMALSLSIAFVGMICAVITIVDMVRLIRMKTNRPAWTNQASGAVTRLSC
jgi:hypothetical protein